MNPIEFGFKFNTFSTIMLRSLSSSLRMSEIHSEMSEGNSAKFHSVTSMWNWRTFEPTTSS
jgi:hypothetical protein